MDTYGWISILPPLLAIFLAIKTKHVYISLGLGIWLGWTIIHGWNPLAGLIQTINALVAVFKDADNTRVVLFSAMIGAIITFTQRSGGMKGFVNWVVGKGLVKTHRSAGLLAWILGFVIFIESSICVLNLWSYLPPDFRQTEGVSGEAELYTRFHLSPQVHPHPVECLGGLYHRPSGSPKNGKPCPNSGLLDALQFLRHYRSALGLILWF